MSIIPSYSFLAILVRNTSAEVLWSFMRIKQLSQDVREQLTMVCKNLHLETRLIDDLLDSTAISRGRVQLCKSDIDLHQLLWQKLQSLT